MKQIIYIIILSIWTLFTCTNAMELELQENSGNTSDANTTEYRFYIPKPGKYRESNAPYLLIKASIILTEQGVSLRPELPEFFRNKYSVVSKSDFLECTQEIYVRCFRKAKLEAQVLTKESYQLLHTKILEENVMAA